MKYTYHKSILGGTFDHFHAGHRVFLDIAFQQSKHVTIGLVADNPKHKLLADQVEDYGTRLTTLTHYLFSHDLLSRVTIIPIHDIYGTSLTDQSIEAIYVTQTTKPNAQIINTKRQELGLTPLAIVTIPSCLADDGEIISSSRIRAGQIDPEGHSYLKIITSKPIYHLPDSLRANLSTPLGIVVKDLQNLESVLPATATIIAVGDIVSMDLSKAGYTPKVSIVDYHTRRRKLAANLIKECFPVAHHLLNNDPGTINSQIAPIILESLNNSDSDKQTQVIVVNGEEDLLVIPAVLLSPLGSYVIYGQYELGMIIAQVTEKLKLEIKTLLSQFS